MLSLKRRPLNACPFPTKATHPQNYCPSGGCNITSPESCPSATLPPPFRHPSPTLPHTFRHPSATLPHTFRTPSAPIANLHASYHFIGLRSKKKKAAEPRRKAQNALELELTDTSWTSGCGSQNETIGWQTAGLGPGCWEGAQKKQKQEGL